MTLAPVANPELFGHEKAESELLRAAQSGRLHHGWLITGPEGIGKATLAYRFARYLLAGGQGDGLAVKADNPIYRRIVAGGHSDLVVVERTENTTGTLRQEIVVDDVRRIEPMFRQTSGEGGWRIAIIDQADLMNENAQNAVLKILEEPPKGALLLLTASSPGRLLPTIRSRVRQLPLDPLPTSVLEKLLAEQLPDLPAGERLQLAILAQGSVGFALALHQAEGLTVYRELLALIGGLHQLPAKPLLDYAEKIGRKEADATYKIVTRLFTDWLAGIARLTVTGEMTEQVEGEGPPMVALSQKLGLERSLALWEKVRDLFNEAEGLNLDRKQAMLSALFAVKEAAA